MAQEPSPPPHAYDAAGFAESVARQYAERGGEAKDLFVALAGLISARDKQVGADCLIALEHALLSNQGASKPE
jgi:hypothetical protein